jgi:hypothetical protein
MITRNILNLAKIQTKLWFNNNMNLIINKTNYILRGDTFVINSVQINELLNNIEFFYDDINKHWAETDGNIIWLNSWHKWRYEDIYYTLIHEVIHGLIKRKGKYDIPEKKEHIIMWEIEPLLI